jgi:hypothetical protein
MRVGRTWLDRNRWKESTVFHVIKSRFLTPACVTLVALCALPSVAGASSRGAYTRPTSHDVNALVMRFQADLRVVRDPARALRGQTDGQCPPSIAAQICPAVIEKVRIMTARAHDQIKSKGRGARILRNVLKAASDLAKKLQQGSATLGTLLHGVPDGVKGCLSGVFGTIAGAIEQHQGISIAGIILGCVHGYLDAKSGQSLPPFSAYRSGKAAIQRRPLVA